MKKIFSLFLSISLFSNIVFADCDFATQIKKLDDGTFAYSKECNLKVGQMQQDLGIANQQVDKLGQAIKLKDTAIQKADDRAKNWMDTSFKLEDRINTIDSMQSTNRWLYFGLGALTIIASAYTFKQLSH